MAKAKLLALIITLAALLAVSGTALLAQSETATIIPPPSFTDGRINDTVGLGGLAIYCVDQNNNTHVDTFENGAITVWGIGDQKYINLSAAQLRGNVEIPQQPSVMEAQMTEAASDATMQPSTMMTEDSTEMMDATPMAMVQEPVLLARTTTPNGEIGFFSLGSDLFALQGYDDKGTFFTYTWTNCNSGTLDHSTGAFLPMLEATATQESSAMMTPEVTPGS